MSTLNNIYKNLYTSISEGLLDIDSNVGSNSLQPIQLKLHNKLLEARIYTNLNLIEPGMILKYYPYLEEIKSSIEKFKSAIDKNFFRKDLDLIATQLFRSAESLEKYTNKRNIEDAVKITDKYRQFCEDIAKLDTAMHKKFKFDWDGLRFQELLEDKNLIILAARDTLENQSKYESWCEFINGLKLKNCTANLDPNDKWTWFVIKYSL